MFCIKKGSFTHTVSVLSEMVPDRGFVDYVDESCVFLCVYFLRYIALLRKNLSFFFVTTLLFWRCGCLFS